MTQISQHVQAYRTAEGSASSRTSRTLPDVEVCSQVLWVSATLLFRGFREQIVFVQECRILSSPLWKVGTAGC